VRVDVVTLFPELFEKFVETSFVGRGGTGGQLEVRIHQLREHGLGKHRSVDDTPYGGGSGMVMRADVLAACLDAIDGEGHRVLMTPQGKPLNQTIVRSLATRPAIVLVCGRYEGFDERVRSLVHEEISLGDFVMTGGEVAAMAVIEACVRLLPGVLGNEDSTREESHADGLLEYPQYTRPVEFRGMRVPDVLQSGNHGEIAKWRREQSLQRTRERRPDLLEKKK